MPLEINTITIKETEWWKNTYFPQEKDTNTIKAYLLKILLPKKEPSKLKKLITLNKEITYILEEINQTCWMYYDDYINNKKYEIRKLEQIKISSKDVKEKTKTLTEKNDIFSIKKIKERINSWSFFKSDAYILKYKVEELRILWVPNTEINTTDEYIENAIHKGIEQDTPKFIYT